MSDLRCERLRLMVYEGGQPRNLHSFVPRWISQFPEAARRAEYRCELQIHLLTTRSASGKNQMKRMFSKRPQLRNQNMQRNSWQDSNSWPSASVKVFCAKLYNGVQRCHTKHGMPCPFLGASNRIFTRTFRTRVTNSSWKQPDFCCLMEVSQFYFSSITSDRYSFLFSSVSAASFRSRFLMILISCQNFIAPLQKLGGAKLFNPR